MLVKIQLYFIFSFIFLAYSRDIILKLDTKQIMDSIIISETSEKYLTKLAEVFAKKAAESFIKEMRNKEYLLSDSRAKSITKKPVHFRISTTTKKSITKEEILSEREAYKLLEQSPPDGDHLGWHSIEESLETEEREGAKTVPVYGLMKVNGIYVRRLLGVGVM
ncbi:uncharacterized protein LOC123866567 [Maniola jurtina]|uniref:uncharacterized protein LOC123866567 n=1 Tax=Maniola jurtina TaxID=191418 RepID=UPI001E68D93A|nr:uncharacterized protein LOC123866567 [Maniola jurtina]